MTGRHVDILRPWHAGNILSKVSTFWDMWLFDSLTCWCSEVQETLWSKCRHSGTCDMSTGRHLEAVTCRKHCGQSVDLLGHVTGQHIEAVSCRKLLGQSDHLLGRVTVRPVDPLCHMSPPIIPCLEAHKVTTQVLTDKRYGNLYIS